MLMEWKESEHSLMETSFILIELSLKNERLVLCILGSQDDHIVGIQQASVKLENILQSDRLGFDTSVDFHITFGKFLDFSGSVP